jgi:hypothetical protein
MAKRVVEVSNGGGGGVGILGVVIGALLVVGVAFFMTDGFSKMPGKGGNSGPSVTINAPSAPSLPSPTTGSGPKR